MRLTQVAYDEAVEEHAGYCTHCDCLTTTEVEPDAEEYECPECQNNTVKGVETALIYGDIEIGEEDDEDVGIISFGDDD